MSNKIRVSVLLEPEIIKLLEKDAENREISLSAIIRNYVSIGIRVQERYDKMTKEVVSIETGLDDQLNHVVRALIKIG